MLIASLKSMHHTLLLSPDAARRKKTLGHTRATSSSLRLTALLTPRGNGGQGVGCQAVTLLRRVSLVDHHRHRTVYHRLVVSRGVSLVHNEVEAPLDKLDGRYATRAGRRCKSWKWGNLLIVHSPCAAVDVE